MGKGPPPPPPPSFKRRQGLAYPLELEGNNLVSHFFQVSHLELFGFE